MSLTGQGFSTVLKADEWEVLVGAVQTEKLRQEGVGDME